MARPQKTQKRLTIRRLTNVLFILAGLACIAGLGIFLFTFVPIFYQEVRYEISRRESPKSIEPVDDTFGIVIPKLDANARVIADVNPNDANEYQKALTRGVAHAKGTAYPGTKGNVFLFAHSSDNFYNATQYNAVFYLINKLEEGDEIELYFNKVKFTYTVTDKKFVSPKAIAYLEENTDESTLMLMTCWPPGTTMQRLLVFATLSIEKPN